MVRRNPKAEDESQPREKLTAGDLRPGGNANAFLLSFVERIERLSEEIGALTEDRTEVFGEAKSTGFDTKILRQVIARRKMDGTDRIEADALRDLYEEALNQAEKAQIAQSIAEGE